MANSPHPDISWRKRISKKSLSALGGFLAFAVAVAVAQAQAANVPCKQLARGVPTCSNPIVQGVVDGQWIGLIERYDGTNGGPTSISIISVGAGGNGEKTSDLGVLRPQGGGDRMSVWFNGGKLYVANEIYLPGEAHCCGTRQIVVRYGFRVNRLVRERSATVPLTAPRAAIYAALKRTATIR